MNLHSSIISSVSVVMRAFLEPTDIQSLTFVSKAVFLSMLWLHDRMKAFAITMIKYESNQNRGYDTEYKKFIFA